MSKCNPVHRENLLEANGNTVLARVRGDGYELLIQESISEIRFCCFVRVEGESYELIEDTTLDVEDSIFDDLQRGSGWRADSLGWNFKHVVDSALLKGHGGKQYRFEFSFVPIVGGQTMLVVEGFLEPVLAP